MKKGIKIEAVKHEHAWTRSKPSAGVDTCACGKWRHNENAGPAIVEVPVTKEAAKPTHTPGHGWTVRESMLNTCEVTVWDGDRFVCAVHRQDEEKPATFIYRARLIAAAPDLLAFAKCAMERFAEHMDGDEVDTTLYNQARAAIIRATEGK